MIGFLFELIILFISILIFGYLLSITFESEVKAALEKDPASKGRLQIVFLYSGFQAIVFYRIAHFLWKMQLPFFPRLISQIGRFITGTEIHPGAQIGKGLFIDHGMGVVVGETAVIGNNVTLFQGVTLGGTGKETGKRHPTIGKNAVIGAGAKVLGNITVGDNSYIGANAVVVKDVPANATVVGVPGRITKQDGKRLDAQMDHIHILDPVMQQIEALKKEIRSLEEKLNKTKK